MLRFAVSPAGDMRIDDLRVAVLNFIVAQQQHKQFIVRIEDIDKESFVPGKDDEIMLILEKFALVHDQRMNQSENLHIHQTLAIRLLEEQKAFVCTCRGEKCTGGCDGMESGEITRLREEKTPFTVRVRKPDAPVVFDDGIRGGIIAAPDEIGSFVILETNGRPTADFASACDDMLSGIDTVITGEEHLESTAKQIYIKHLLGYETSTDYAHLPSLMYGEEDGASLQRLFEQGFLPDAILNYLIALGYDTPTEIFTLPEAIEWFDLSKISREPVEFDLERLRYINREHLRMMDDKRLSSVFGFADAAIGQLAKLYLSEASTIGELEPKIQAIFSPKERGEEMKHICDIIFDAKPFATYEEFRADIASKSAYDGETLDAMLRYLLTGAHEGPALHDIYPYIKSYILEIAS